MLIAANGRQGLELLAKEHLDMVFLDYMMPVMDGAAVLRCMIDDPSWRSIPVVLMSSMPEATVAERCSGYAIFMRKPFKIGEVIALALQLIPGSSNRSSRLAQLCVDGPSAFSRNTAVKVPRPPRGRGGSVGRAAWGVRDGHGTPVLPQARPDAGRSSHASRPACVCPYWLPGARRYASRSRC